MSPFASAFAVAAVAFSVLRLFAASVSRPSFPNSCIVLIILILIVSQKRVRGSCNSVFPFAAERVPPSPAAVERQLQLLGKQPQREAAGGVLLLEAGHGAYHRADDAVVLPEAAGICEK